MAPLDTPAPGRIAPGSMWAPLSAGDATIDQAPAPDHPQIFISQYGSIF